MDDHTIDVSYEATKATLDDMVASGLLRREIVIQPDGSSESAYSLTEKGMEEATALILRLGTPTAPDEGNDHD